MSTPPDWLSPATDLLKQHGLDEAAGSLAMLAKLANALEDILSMHVLHDIATCEFHEDRALALLAEYRGETPDRVLDRLGPEWAVADFRRLKWAREQIGRGPRHERSGNHGC